MVRKVAVWVRGMIRICEENGRVGGLQPGLVRGPLAVVR